MEKQICLQSMLNDMVDIRNEMGELRDENKRILNNLNAYQKITNEQKNLTTSLTMSNERLSEEMKNVKKGNIQ